MDVENLFQGNIFRYFGSSAVMPVSDNLKTGMNHTSDWNMPQINRTYRELAESFHTAVMQARIRKYKDKSETYSAGMISARIIAALLN